MKMPKRDNKYKEGSAIYANVAPSLKLIIRRYVNRIYYCKVAGDPTLKERVYFERELTSIPVKTA